MPTDDKLTQVSQKIDEVTRIVAQVTPLAALTVEGFKALSAFLQRNGQNTVTFDAAISEYESKQAELKTTIDDFRQKYPRA